MINKHKIHHENGFTLLEALLTTAILSGIFIIIIGILQNYSETILAKSTANYMNKISTSIEDILVNPEYFSQIYTLANSQPNKILEITTANIIAGSIGSVTVPQTSYLNSNFKNTTPFKTGVQIMIRADTNNALEIIIATDALVDDQKVRTAAEYSRLNGGYYRNGSVIKNAYNAWSFNPNVLAGSTWRGISTATPPTVAGGSYLFNYKHMAFDDVAGDYLYRIRVTGNGELNTLYGDLDMGNQNILGADNINPNGDVDFNTNAVVNGSMRVQGNSSFNDGNFNTYSPMTTNDAIVRGVGTGRRGNFDTQGTLNTTDLGVSQDINADQATFQSGANAPVSLSATSITSVNNINSNNVNARQLQGAGGSELLDIDTNGQMNIQQVNTPTLTINGNNKVGVLDLQASNGATISGPVNSPKIVIDDLNVGTFGACDRGC